VQYSLKQNMTI